MGLSAVHSRRTAGEESVVLAEPEPGDAVEDLLRPLVVGFREVLRGLPELPVQSVLGLLVGTAAVDRAAERLDPSVDDLVLDVVVELVHGGVLVDVVVVGVEAGAGELVDPLPDVGEVGPTGLRFEPDVPHVHGGAVLAAHGLLGAVAGGVEGTLPGADEDDLGAGVPHLRVVRGGAELDDLPDGVLLEQLTAASYVLSPSSFLSAISPLVMSGD